MKINFYLPQAYRGIAGGYKVIYQYSNYLVNQGHDVCIYYDLKDGRNSHHIPKIITILLRRILFIGYPRWFKLDDRVKQKAVNHFDNLTVRDADISIATAPYTAYPVKELSESKGKKYYFIQGYENWDGASEEYLHTSYGLGMNNIVISSWLKSIVDQYAKNESVIVGNGIDLDIFKINNPIEERKEHVVSMIYHDSYIKGCDYGIEALEKIKKIFPDTKAILFGGVKRPNNLPSWIKYVRNANENQVVEILNESSVFMCTSLFEGFCLPGLESMACGATLITTKCQGPEEYANETNSILCNSKSSEELFEAIKELFENDEKRISIAQKAYEDINIWSLVGKEKEFEEILRK